MNYSFSLNIINNNRVINPAPYLYVSDNLSSIILEVRNLLKDIIWQQFDINGINLSGWKTSIIVWSKTPGNVHIIDINCNNVKEVQQLIIEQNARNKYQDIMDNIKN